MILNTNGHEINGNGASLTERQMAKQMAQNATIGEVNDIAWQHAVKATNHLGNQIPELVQRLVNQTVSTALQGFYESLKARGMLLEAKEIVAPDPANVTDSEAPE